MLALGGQGGGVLTKWLVDIAESNGYLAQSTYVAGVAQRTGATVYCIEMLPEAVTRGREPVFVQYPIPGDVDLAIASELVEAGRAIQKGFVTPQATTLIASSHRVYSIDEKSALGNGIVDSKPIIDAARAAARRLVCFDMQAAAEATGSVISSVILGAIAGTGVLPFPRAAFEEAIRRAGKAVDANLAGFAAGFDGGVTNTTVSPPEHPSLPDPTAAGAAGAALLEQVAESLPEACRAVAGHGALRTLAYQDRAYAEDYLRRLREIVTNDAEHAGRDCALSKAVARELALQMCYEDTIRVAELKIRSARFETIRRDIGASNSQPYYVTEYFHPRYEEFCDTLPAWLAKRLLGSRRARRLLAPVFGKGRNISTNRIGGFLMLRLLAGWRRWRRSTHRFAVQSEFIDEWLSEIKRLAAADYRGATELAEAMQIVRGYGETYERGLLRYRAILQAARSLNDDVRATHLRSLRGAAAADEQGALFEQALRDFGVTST